MRANLSMPTAPIVPVLAYVDVPQAARWLCHTFGFVERLRIGTHRIQLTFGGDANAALVVMQAQRNAVPITDARSHIAGAAKLDGTSHPITTDTSRRAMPSHSIMLRVDDVNAHYAHAAAMNAHITSAPTDFSFGERQYSAVDIGGHAWTFSETIADCDPATWGGQLL